MKSLRKIMMISTVFLLSIILVGCGKAKTYTITFDSNGGTKVEKQEIKENKKIEEPDDPTKEGYKFLGWYLDGKKYDFDKKVTKNLKLKAKWSKETEEVLDTYEPVSYIVPMVTVSKPEVQKIDYMSIAKAEIKDFDVLEASPALQTTAANGKCSVAWLNADVLDNIVRDTTDTKVDMTASITCEGKTEEVTVKAIIKKSPYKYTTTTNNNSVVTIISIDGATDYTIKNTKTTAKYLNAVGGAQVLNRFHTSGDSYMMWFATQATKYVVEEGVI